MTNKTNALKFPNVKKTSYTTAEVAEIVEVSDVTVGKWFDRGLIKGYRIPGSKHRRIPRKELERFIRTHGLPMRLPK